MTPCGCVRPSKSLCVQAPPARYWHMRSKTARSSSRKTSYQRPLSGRPVCEHQTDFPDWQVGRHCRRTGRRLRFLWRTHAQAAGCGDRSSYPCTSLRRLGMIPLVWSAVQRLAWHPCAPHLSRLFERGHRQRTAAHGVRLLWQLRWTDQLDTMMCVVWRLMQRAQRMRVASAQVMTLEQIGRRRIHLGRQLVQRVQL